MNKANKILLVIAAACIVALAVIVVKGIKAQDLLATQNQELQEQLELLTKQEKRSTVMQRVNAQMEEIANEQREISDEQRENALQQTRVANEMRERSEIERQNAIIAERNAVASEKKALEASEVAEAQRQMADHQRIQAELSKRIADTLSYVALARSLGSLSSIQAQLGYTELSDLLAYSSYHFINRYQGDVYYPAIFQSLMTASQSKRSWSKHNGALMKCAYMSDKDDRMVTVSSYGTFLPM